MGGLKHKLKEIDELWGENCVGGSGSGGGSGVVGEEKSDKVNSRESVIWSVVPVAPAKSDFISILL